MMARMSTAMDETTWGRWPTVRLADDTLAAVLVPRVGGRIISLVIRIGDRLRR
jgi:hypothetical protein